MKQKLLLALAVTGVAVLVAFGVWWAVAPHASLVREGDMAPDFALPHYNLPARHGTLAELRGEPVVLVRFDSRWPRTGAYLAELEKIHRRFLRDGLVVVGVAFDPAEEQRALEYVLDNRNVTFTVLLDPGGAATGPAYGMPRDRPETYLIDTAGRVRSIELEPRAWTSQTALSRLGALIPTPTPTPTPESTPSSLDRTRPGG